MVSGQGIITSKWLHFLDGNPVGNKAFTAIYGAHTDLLEGRFALLRRVLERYREQFGDVPVRVFRSPGRINLRGMHVDTHGGYLNLMTHQRETVVVAGLGTCGDNVFVNVEPDFGEVRFRLFEEGEAVLRQGQDWEAFLKHPGVATRVRARKQQSGQEWGNYLIGASLAAALQDGPNALPGMHAAVGSDLPRGAALSSSAALCVAVMLAQTGLSGMPMSQEALIQGEQNAEWYAGARVGMSDQGAMVMGRQGTVLNVTFFGDDFEHLNAQYFPLPPEAAILVINTYTRRSLSGAQLVDYTRNRFAYSMAMHVLRRELAEHGVDTAGMDRLSHITPESLGGPAAVYALLRRIPEALSVEEIRGRYNPPDLEGAYERYFGGVKPSDRPTIIQLRGPLSFGIAESERARSFACAVAAGDLPRLGRLMTVGHDGDRIVRSDGSPFLWRPTDALLHQMEAEKTPVALCPGAYGASSPVLDLMVDTALEAGALGACLTGAGIAGAVLALCRRDAVAPVVDAARKCLGSEEYLRRSKRSLPLSAAEIDAATVVNHATAGAGEIPFPG